MFPCAKIWNSTLEPQGDLNDVHRARLKAVFLGFREKVGQLIQTIPTDIPGLTVHDLSHLDALWDMADILTGGDYRLNPAEAFVLGGAILLHDSAMTVAAYLGGVDEIKGTPEYSDAVASIGGRLGRPIPTGGIASDPTVERFALSEALRIRHATKAEELASQAWTSPITGAEIYLIEDGDLRDQYSRVIGRIAHSHHWDINAVVRNMGSTLGAFSGFPSDWTIDQLKVALILRCIDAMQVDDRRAPRFLASIREVGAESMEHWRFQNKLAVPHLEDRRLVYSSKSPFQIEHATAWNLCFDTIQMIDRELRDANDLHLQRGIHEFRAIGVTGAGSAELFANHVEVIGWRPLPLNLNVSDVPKLARTLGGQDLYSQPLAPLRELIQNAADSIDARSLIDDDFSIADGLITVRFIQSGGDTILEIEDNGVGMSERVLTTALLDFGFSFWKSAAARAEFPGLQAKVERLRGKYGIGFFSIFMWSSQLAVCSRRFNEGVDSTRVLDFRHGLESRPLLRSGGAGEKSSKWSTKIRVKLAPNFLDFGALRSRREQNYTPWDMRPDVHEGQSWLTRLRLLCGPLPIRVTLETSSGTEVASLPNWMECEPATFLEFFDGVIFEKSPNLDRFGETLSNLFDAPPQGGRCFISPYSERGGRVGVYEKGIFISFASGDGASGIVQSNVTNAARDRFKKISVVDKQWLSIVAPKAFKVCRNIGERIAIQRLLGKIDEPDASQPLFVRNREFISMTELRRVIVDDGYFHIRLTESEENQFSWKSADKLNVITGLVVDEQRVYPLIPFVGTISNDGNIKAQIDGDIQPLFRFLRGVRDLLGPGVVIGSAYHEVSGYREDYIDISIETEHLESRSTGLRYLAP